MEPQHLLNGAKGLAVAGSISGYILGPLILCGGIGWYLTDRFDNKMFILAGVGIAFILSNVLILKNSARIINSLKKSR